MKKENKLKVFKIRETAQLPRRAHPTDAGADIFYCPAEKSIDQWRVLKPGQTDLFETGLKNEVPPGHMLQVMNKSGIAFKKQLVTGACVVDCGYDGEVFVNLHNIGLKNAIIEPGQKIAQIVLMPIDTPEFVEVLEDKIYDSDTDRGTGGFGSTGDF